MNARGDSKFKKEQFRKIHLDGRRVSSYENTIYSNEVPLNYIKFSHQCKSQDGE